MNTIEQRRPAGERAPGGRGPAGERRAIAWADLMHEAPGAMTTWQDNARRAGANRFDGWLDWVRTAGHFLSEFDGGRLFGEVGRRIALAHLEVVFDLARREAGR